MLHKITHGYMRQVYDPHTRSWLSQQFVVGDDLIWENEAGETVDISEVSVKEPYLAYPDIDLTEDEAPPYDGTCKVCGSEHISESTVYENTFDCLDCDARFNV